MRRHLREKEVSQMVNWRTADEQRLNVVLKDEKRLLREADTNMGLFMLEIYCGKDL